MPSHCNIPENENADKMAKKGCFVKQAPYNIVSYKSVSSLINQLKIMHVSLLKELTKEK